MIFSPSQIRSLLNKYNASPNKIMGQNFLIDKKTVEKIIKTADLNKNDTALEVGPGIGALTYELAKNAGHVITVEKDKVMCQILKETLTSAKNVQIINADILRVIPGLTRNPHKVVANIPYYLTSTLIRALLENKNQPEEIILLIQKEVAQRICAKPPKMSLLAVSVQFYAEAKIISYVSKNCFWPAPKVDSAIIKITPNSKFKIQNSKFFAVAKAGFSQPRKQLINNLSTKLKISKKQAETWLLQNKIKPSRRAETLSIEDWQNLAS